MFQKATLALAAVVALGTATLTPTADAHWKSYGWYGMSYGYPSGTAMARATTAASTAHATSTAASSAGRSSTATTAAREQ
jgi:hypothetical protein